MLKIKVGCAIAFLFATGITFPGVANADDCSELPPSTNIQCFDVAGLSNSQASFCGIWGEGRWDDVLPHCLAIERIEPSGVATVVYTWGRAPEWQIRVRGFVRVEAEIRDNMLELSEFGNGAVATYRMRNGELHGEYLTATGNISRVILNRFEN